MSARRSRTDSRLPLVYWRAVAPNDSDLLRQVRTGPAMKTLESDLTLERIAGAQLDGMSVARPRSNTAEVIAQLSPDGEAVADMHSVVNELRGADSADDWAQLSPANRLVVREDDFKIPRLRVKNLAPGPVLLPAGSAFIGGAQNRMLLEPAVISGGAERSLGVFCVEAGRWDESQPAFRAIGRVPALFLLRVLEAAAGRYSEYAAVPAQQQDLQVYAWETVLAGLTLAGTINPTMDLMAFARNIPRSPGDVARESPAGPGAHSDRNGAARQDSKSEAGAWGLFHADRESGTAACALYPNEEFMADATFALKSDLAWRGDLLRNGRGAREYYRIFDESQRLAIRCMPDGSPLRDLRGKPVVFEYTDADLEHSFRPPLQTPPPPEALSFAREPLIQDWSEMRQHLGECRVAVRKILEAGAGRGRPGAKPPPEKHILRFAHPRRSMIGSGLLIGGRPAYLEATAFRPYAN